MGGCRPKNRSNRICMNLLKILRAVFISILLFIVFYLLLIFFGARINTSAVKDREEVSIYILTNGVHTDIVVPSITEDINWEDTFNTNNTSSQKKGMTYTAIGWGDKGFYLNTPTWADLSFKTAFKAAFALGSSAVHITYYDTIKTSDSCKEIKISTRQYKLLVKYINNTLKNKNKKAIFIKTDANYGENDAFYEAKGKYNIFYTCNAWANSALKSCEQKACLWTPFDKAIFNLYK